MRKVTLLLAIFATTGCVTDFWMSEVTGLSAEAQHIAVIETLSPDQEKELIKLSEINCKLGQNSALLEENVRSCENRLRNEAARLGATALLVDPKKNRKIGTQAAQSFFSGAMNCDNCVFIDATAYRAKNMDKLTPLPKSATTIDKLCDTFVDCSVTKESNTKKKISTEK